MKLCIAVLTGIMVWGAGISAQPVQETTSGKGLVTFHGKDLSRIVTPTSPRDKPNSSQTFESLSKFIAMDYVDTVRKSQQKQDSADDKDSFDDFKSNHWPTIVAGQKVARAEFDHYKTVLTSYTLEQKADPSLTADKYWEGLSEHDKDRAGISVLFDWQHRLERYPTPESIEQQMAPWPTTPEAAFKAFGNPEDAMKFNDAWTLREIDKIQPGLSDLFTDAAMIDLLTTSANTMGQLTREEALPHVESNRSAILEEVRIRLVVQRELDNIKFQDATLEKDFRAYLEQRLNTTPYLGHFPWAILKVTKE